MRTYLILILFFLSGVCNAQNQHFTSAVTSQTVDQHIAWIVDVYTYSLKMTKQQRDKLFETIRIAYLEVPSNEFFGKVRGKDDLELLQSMVIHTKVENEFPVILSKQQLKAFLAMKTRPEDCVSLSKEYSFFPCCPSFKSKL